MMKMASYAWGVVLLLVLIATPISCQRVQRVGPAWAKALPDEVPDVMGARKSDDGLEFTAGLLMVVSLLGAAACFIGPNIKRDGNG